jgi:Membrane protease subunits, stomatin/prohibitin homologs
MFLVVVLVLLAIGVFFVPKEIHSFKTMKVKIGVWALLVVVFAMSFVTHVKPGEIVRVYQLAGGERTLTVGYNILPAWDKTQTWDASTVNYSFKELGDENDPNDAFGGQTKNGDYMTVVANLAVRIDPDRMAQYIATFGTRNLDEAVGATLKGILKNSFEQCLETRETETVMSSKSQIEAEAIAIAVARIQSELPLIVTSLTYPDIVASPEYEAAIKMIADARMQEQLAEARKLQNIAEAGANAEAANGQAAVVQINADASKYQQETAATAQANSLATIAQAEADALLVKALAEAEAGEKLGLLFAQYPGLLESKRIDVYGEIGALWDGRQMPSFGGNGVNILDIAGILDAAMQQQNAGANSTVPNNPNP